MLLGVAGATPPSWHNTSLDALTRASALIASLTLNEKVSLLQVSQPEIERVGLPSYDFGRECERGDTSGKLGTAYPTGLALGGSFDVELVHAIAIATAIEVRGNVNTAVRDAHGSFGASCFGPVSNLVRDPRWGRAAEMVTGEDPQLGRLMSRAFTWGIQKRADNSTKSWMVNTVAKHLNTYGGPEGTGYTFGEHAERFDFEARLSEREWREFFLPPFFGAAEAGVTGFMCSYSSMTFTDHPERSTNTPACANKYMLHDVVRREWNWTGYILSDAGATAFVGSTQVGRPGDPWHESNRSFGHHFAASPEEAAVKALDAGLDLELTCCGVPAVFPTLNESIRAGKIAESVLDASLQRTLPIRFKLGQLDGATASDRQGLPDNVYAKLSQQENVSTPTMAALALSAAKKSIILLKNERATLPLSKSLFAQGAKVLCMFGPNANSSQAQQGGYVPHPRFITTPFAGMTTALSSSRSVKLVPGCSNSRCETFDKAAVVAALKKGVCDAHIAVLGLTAYANPGSHLQPPEQVDATNACGCIIGDGVEGECCDRVDVQMPGAQLELLQLIAAAGEAHGVPVVLVSVNAGMLDLSWAKSSPAVGAILNAGYLGQATGTALAATVFGENNPAARLPISYYEDVDDIGPITQYHMHPVAGVSKGRTYRYSTAPMIWPFGYGLSYSSFEYSAFHNRSSLGVFKPCQPIDVRVTLELTKGAGRGEEVSQLYIGIRNASVPVAKHQLVSFTRQALVKSIRKVVSFTILPEDHAVLRDPDFAQTIEPGMRTVWVGGGQPGTGAAGVAMAFEVKGTAATVDECAAMSGGAKRAPSEWKQGNTDAHLWSP